MRGCLRIGIPILILIATLIYCAFPHPIQSQAKLKTIAAESRRLIASYPVGPSGEPVHLSKDKWPPGIASLDPYWVMVGEGMVDITTEPFFDGGWGYGFAADKRNLTMLVECWSELGHDVYWHGPC